MAITFEDLQALAIDTRTLPPMESDGRNAGRKGQRDRTAQAKRESRAMRQAQNLKRESVAA